MVGGDEALLLPWLMQPLREALRAEREHHALLIHGPRGVGQLELALLLAKGWLCESDDRATRPCGRCAGCLLTSARNHPDLLVLLPEMLRLELGWISIGEVDNTGSTTKKPSKDIKVDAVRFAVEFAQTTSARGRAKVVLIYPAERMNTIAANALLKTLEEPPGLARFLLATGDRQALSATVLSRCQMMHLPAPPADVAHGWLEEQGVVRPTELLAAAGGQPLEALAWAKGGIDANAVAHLPELVLRGDSSQLAAWPVPRVIDLLQKLCHDILTLEVAAAPRYFAGLPPMSGVNTTLLHEWAAALAHAACHGEHPWNAGLMIESLVLQGRRACQGLPAQERSHRARSLHSAP